MKNIIRYTYNDVDFSIDEDGELCSLFDNQADVRDVFIPSKLYIGDKIIPITSIGSGVCRCAFSKVTISDEIKDVKPQAFSHSYIDEVVWPKGCKTIPHMCFAFSNVGKVYNIDNVVRIGERAFQESSIRAINWPSACKTIPFACFSDSFLTNIINADQVNKVDECAFSGCNKLEKLDLSGSFLLNVEKHAFAGLAPEIVDLPYYYSVEALSTAFQYA